MWFRKRRDSDFDAEIEAHILLEADRLMAEGMPPAEAQAAARRTFGNATIAREDFFEGQRWLWFHQLGQDLRYGLRSFRKAPAFTAVVILTIALGVGASTGVFSLMEAVLLRSLPVENPKELVFLETAGTAGPSGPPSYPGFSRLRDETTSFSGMAAFASDELRIQIDGSLEQVMGQATSGNYFQVLGLKPRLGRLMDAEDEKLAPPITVISERYWRRRFGGDPGVIGKSISIGRKAFTIVGVTPAEFFGLQPGSPVDITFPIDKNGELVKNSETLWLHGIIARLKPGASADAAQAEADSIYRSFMSTSRFPTDLIAKHWRQLQLLPGAHGMDGLRRRFSEPLYVLMGIVGLVQLLAIANVANLLLARGISRGREFAIRLAAGAGRARVVRQLATETLLLFCLGAVPGVLLAGWGVGLVESLFRQGRRPIILEAGLNGRVLAFALAVTFLAGLISSLIPAWRAFRTDPEQAIKEGQDRMGESRGSAMLAHGLVAFQVGLSLVLLVGAVAFVRTLASLRNVDLGFRTEEALTMSLRLPEGYTHAGPSIAVWNQALESVRRLPDVRAAALSIFTPLSGRDRGGLVRVRGYEPPTTEDATIHFNQVSEGYFEVLGMSLLRGRLFTDRDVEGTTRVALINESAARKYFGDRDPIGESLEFRRTGGNITYRIVGVVRDTKHMNLREPSKRFAFLPLRQPRDVEQRVTLIVAPRTPNGEMKLLQPVRNAVARIDRRILISDVITIRSQLDGTLLTERLLSGLSSAFGLLAMILASIGLYGVLSYRIGRQRLSIGIQMALGATPSYVALRVLRQSGVVIVAGLTLGLPFAMLAARLADTLFWGVKASDPMIYIASAALLSFVGIASAYLPARRAAGVDPARALRHG